LFKFSIEASQYGILLIANSIFMWSTGGGGGNGGAVEEVALVGSTHGE